MGSGKWSTGGGEGDEEDDLEPIGAGSVACAGWGGAAGGVVSSEGFGGPLPVGMVVRRSVDDGLGGAVAEARRPKP